MLMDWVMELSRRSFLASVSAVAAFVDRPLLGSPNKRVDVRSGQTVINLPGPPPSAFANNLKFVSFPLGASANFPTKVNRGGFPADGILKRQLSYGLQPDPTYYGRYKLWWAGKAGVLFQGPPALIYSGGSSIPGSASRSVATTTANLRVGGNNMVQPTREAPVELAWGFLIGGAVSQKEKHILFATAEPLMFGAGVTSGWKVRLNNLTYDRGPFPDGPNVDGSWTITNAGPKAFTLNGSERLNPALIGIIGAGGPGRQTEAILPGAANMTIPEGTVIEMLQDLTLCKNEDYDRVVSGGLASTNIVNFLKYTKPRFLRVMDAMAVQGDRSSGFGSKGTEFYRVKPFHMSWLDGAYQLGDYYTPSNTVANGGSDGNFTDVYTCASPAASSALGEYQDGEIIMGQLGNNDSNRGTRPALNVNGRGLAPIYEGTYAQMLAAFWTGTVPPSGTVVTATFFGAGLAEPRSIKYTIQNKDTIDSVWRGLASVAQADLTLTSLGIWMGNQQGQLKSQGGFYFCPNITSDGGRLVASLGSANFSVTVSDPTGSIAYTMGTLGIGQMPKGSYVSFTYSRRLGGWLMQAGDSPPLHCSVPYEWFVDMCTSADVGLYITVGQLWSDQRVHDIAHFFGSAGVRELCIELSNETWNFGLQEWSFAIMNGSTLGLGSGNIYANAQEGWIGLRTAQISKAAAKGWADAGRNRSELFINICFQLGSTIAGAGAAPLAIKQLGKNLNAADPKGPTIALAAFGGDGGSSITTDHSQFPNRPVDWSDAMGQAPYWGGLMLNSGNGPGMGMSTNCVLESYDALLLAAYNYRYGSSAERDSALNVLYTGGPDGRGELYGDTPNGFLRSKFTATVVGPVLMVSQLVGSIEKGQYVVVPGVPEGTYVVGGFGSSWRLSRNGLASSVEGKSFSLGGFQPNSSQTLFFYKNGDMQAAKALPQYLGIGFAAASFDNERAKLPTNQVGQEKIAVINYEGGWAFGPAGLAPAPDDITQFARQLIALGYKPGYTSSLPGVTTNANAPSGADDTASLAAQNIWLLLNGNFGGVPGVPETSRCFKTDERCFDLVSRYIVECNAASKVAGDRVACAAWFGFLGNSIGAPNWWSLYLGTGIAPFGASKAVEALAAHGGS
jgi:hypothetical protein